MGAQFFEPLTFLLVLFSINKPVNELIFYLDQFSGIIQMKSMLGIIFPTLDNRRKISTCFFKIY